MSPREPRILLVEDHPIIAAGLQALLEDHDGFRVVGIGGSLAEGIRLARQERPAVAVVDYRLPDGTGDRIITELQQDLPEMSVIILTAETADEPLLEAASAGAAGYVRKSEAPTRLIDAIERVLAGGDAIPAHDLARALQADRRRRQDEEQRERVRSSLTPREREILDLLARGRDNRAIAAELVVGYATVRTHVQSVIEKLGARSRLEAVARAVDLGIIERQP